MKFVKRTPTHNVFELDCTCGAVGEIGVPKRKMNEVFKHDTCCALLIQKPAPGMFGVPSLEVVTETL